MTSKLPESLASILLTTILISGCSVQSAYYSENLPTKRVSAIDESERSFTLFLLGDAGDPSLVHPEPVLEALRLKASVNPEKNLILYLGDNLYPHGLPPQEDPERKISEQRLTELMDVISASGARGVFIPGNHDWASWEPPGLEAVRDQAAFVESDTGNSISFLPVDGTPGPVLLEIGEGTQLVVLDTQWWLQDGPKTLYPGIPGVDSVKAMFLDSLSSLLGSSRNPFVIVAGHHPLDSHGPHGGFYDWKDHLFPLQRLESWLWLPIPVLGSVYPLVRSTGVSSQDLVHSEYAALREGLAQAFDRAPYVIYVAGHEHSIQVLRLTDKSLQVISGAGCATHNSALGTDDNTIFAYPDPGFIQLDFLHDGRVRLGVSVPAQNDAQPNEIFSMWIYYAK